LFAVPGAFTPTCSAAHLPGFVANADKILAKGVDAIVCLSVNDAFVMAAWGASQNAEALVMAADGNGEFTTAMGLTLDGSGFGLGHRSSRYALIAENGTITALNADQGGAFEVSSAEKILEAL
jgi:peroxiredoxin